MVVCTSELHKCARESIWVCVHVSICALFVCHSPLKLQLPSRHDFPLCRNQRTSQHLTNTSQQSLRLKEPSITLMMTHSNGFFWAMFPVGTSHILTQLTCRRPNKRCSWAATSTRPAASNDPTPLVIDLFLFLLYSCFFPWFFNPPHHPAPIWERERERGPNTGSN